MADPFEELEALFAKSTDAPVPLPTPQVVGPVPALGVPPLPRPRPPEPPKVESPEVDPTWATFEALLAGAEPEAVKPQEGAGEPAGAQMGEGLTLPSGQGETPLSEAPRALDEAPPSNAGPQSDQAVGSFLTTAAAKSYQQSKADFALAKAAWTGDLTDLKSVIEMQKAADRYVYDEDLERDRLEYEQTKGFWDSLGKLATSPRLTASLVGESLMPMVGSAGAGAAAAGVGAAVSGPAAPIGAGVGYVVGTAGGVAVMSAGSNIRDFLRSKGIDPDDEEQLTAALSDPKMRQDAIEYAGRKGVATGLVEAIIGKVGGKAAATLAQSGRGVAGGVTGLTAESVGAGAGGAAGSLAVGEEVSMKQLAGDMFLEAAGGGVLDATVAAGAGMVQPREGPADPAAVAAATPVQPTATLQLTGPAPLLALPAPAPAPPAAPVIALPAPAPEPPVTAPAPVPKKTKPTPPAAPTTKPIPKSLLGKRTPGQYNFDIVAKGWAFTGPEALALKLPEIEKAYQAIGTEDPQRLQVLNKIRDIVNKNQKAPPVAPEPPASSGLTSPDDARSQGRDTFIYVKEGQTEGVGGSMLRAEAQAAQQGGKLIAVSRNQVEPPRKLGAFFSKDMGQTTPANIHPDLLKFLDDYLDSTSAVDKHKAETAYQAWVDASPDNKKAAVDVALASGAPVTYKGPTDGLEVDWEQISYAGFYLDPTSNIVPGKALASATAVSLTSDLRGLDIDLNKVPSGALIPAVSTLEVLSTSVPDPQAFVDTYIDAAGSDKAALGNLTTALKSSNISAWSSVQSDLDAGRLKAKSHPDLYRSYASVSQDPTMAAAVRAALVEAPGVPSYVPIRQRIDRLATEYLRDRKLRGTKTNFTLWQGNAAVLARYPKDIVGTWHVATRMLKELVEKLNPGLDLEVVAYDPAIPTQPGYKADNGAFRHGGGSLGRIVVNMTEYPTPASVYRVLSHEFGHYLSAAGLLRTDLKARAAIFAAYRRYQAGLRAGTINTDQYAMVAGSDYQMRKDNPYYIMTFEEWWAEQVARWAFSNQRPVGIVERLAKSVGQMVRNTFQMFAERSKQMGFEYRAEPEVSAWLNSLLSKSTTADYSEALAAVQRVEGKTQNAKDLGLRPEEVDKAPEMTAEGVPLRNALEKIGFDKLDEAAREEGFGPFRSKQIAPQVDRFNRFYKHALTLQQLAILNPDTIPLQRYRELVALATVEQQKIMVGADNIVKSWRGLGRTQADNLGKFFFDLTEMVYLTPAEKANGVVRQPTPQEFAALVQQYGLSNKALDVYRQVNTSFIESLDRYMSILIDKANAIQDPQVKAQKLQDLATQRRQLLARPYFPMTRFGQYYIKVVDPQGKLIHFETFESRRQQMSAFKRARRAYPQGTGYDVKEAILQDDFKPFMGVPPQMFDLIGKALNLTPAQQQVIEGLRIDLAPAQSFKKHFMHRKGMSGYSTNALRNYAHYMFHHSRHYARSKYGDLMRDELDAIKKLIDTGRTHGNKLSGIHRFVGEHLEEFMNPTTDWAGLRSLMAIFWLGFSPASALVNMTQTALVTAPFLSTQFGDLKAQAAIMKAATHLRSTYQGKKVRPNSQGLQKALEQAVQEGLINESQAIELAALSGGGLLASAGGAELARGWNQVASKAMFMFEQVEILNRRIAFRAAWELAMANPQAKYLQDLQFRFPLQFQRLKALGWTDAEAVAFLAGRDTIHRTQFEYGRHARPKFMQGRKSALFLFYLFTQNMIFMMGPTNWRNGQWKVGARFVLTLMALGGAQALPGYEDSEEVAKAIAYHFFGKDFDLDREVRKYVLDVVGPDHLDTVMHGAARTGFGFPAAMRMMGATWMPDVDLSGSISMGNLSPIKLGFLNPGNSVERSMSEALTGSAGAAFGPLFALFKALQSHQTGQLRTWEPVMPRAIRGAVKAWRLAQEGGETNQKGAMVAGIDLDDPEDRAEWVATLLGFQVPRIRNAWEYRIMEGDAQRMQEVIRRDLMNEFARAVKDQDKDARKVALQKIREWNRSLEDKTYTISSQQLDRSIKQRAEARVLSSKGLPHNETGIPTSRELQKLFPGAVETRPLSSFK